MFQIRLKELREKKNISQAQLAQYLGVRQSTVAMWESGKNRPLHAMLLKIAEYFNVDIDYLLGLVFYPDEMSKYFCDKLSGLDFSGKLYVDDEVLSKIRDRSYRFNEMTLAQMCEAAKIDKDTLEKDAQEYLDYTSTLNYRENKENLDKQLSNIEFALYGEIRDLTDDEKQKILDFAKFTKSLRDKK